MPQVNYTNKALHAPARVYVRMCVCAYSTQESGSAGESDNLTTFECQNSMGWVHANISGVSGRACDRWMAFCIVSEVGIVSGSGMCLCVCVCVCARVCARVRDCKTFPSAGQTERDKTRNCSSIHNWKRINWRKHAQHIHAVNIDWMTEREREGEEARGEDWQLAVWWS